ncbi:hypothetical protein HANVADRAFT_21988 [Hanseniaspora valbyensis NRRL Y-1626]|uniref:Peptidase M48 domain-containing protein n=1 Tax=Hanseniaspora valbyensis NRRL Y-1626 TaxID=766949 RepID=A0A1B7THT3_9ASCO|nr:hypothetical protein HANVADRAFT_21988 [Hanseniaspora valbyensis NRRL Y-1626]
MFSRTFKRLYYNNNFRRRPNNYRNWDNNSSINSPFSSTPFYQFYSHFKTTNGKRQLLIFGSLGASFYFYNLETVPLSNRLRFSWIPDSLMVRIGKMSYNSVMSQYSHEFATNFSQDHRLVTSIFNKLLKQAIIQEKEIKGKSSLENLNWEIHVIENKTYAPNAFVVPGGKVFVFSSLLDLCGRDPDMIATVLGHELSHQLCGHSAESLSKSPLYFALGIAFYMATGLDGGRMIVDMLMQLPASRNMELEADYAGLLIMSKSCYNPDKSWQLWERMQKLEQKNRNINVEFLSTHPSSDKREMKFKEWLPKARQIYESSDCGNNGFLGDNLMKFYSFK